MCFSGLVQPSLALAPQPGQHEEIHHGKGQQAGQKAALNNMADRPGDIDLADPELGDPKQANLDGKLRQDRALGGTILLQPGGVMPWVTK